MKAHLRSILCLVFLIGLMLGAGAGLCFGEAANEDEAKIFSAGYKAGFMCSAVFLAKRDPKDVMREELGGENPLHMAPGDPVVDYTTKSVSCSAGEGLPTRLAVFREGYGTVLLPPGATLEYVKKLPQVKMPFPKGDPANIAWPDGDRLPDKPLRPEVNKVKLERAVEAAFSAKKYQPSKTLGVVVVYQGRIIAERYAPGWSMHTQYRSWSSAKSITSALVGIMVGQGKLDVEALAPIPEWQAADRGLEAEPGTRWKYSNYDTLLLVRSIKEVLGDQEKYLTLPRRALLNKIGMRHTFPEIDPYGNFILSSQMYTTARDLARFGLLYLNDGVWNGERILPEGWVEYTRHPAPAKEAVKNERGYGKQFWLMNYDDRVPNDAYTTSGARGQLSTIIPSRDLVVVRTGLDPRPGAEWSQEEFVSDVLQAIETE